MQNPIFMIFTVKFYSYKQYTNLMKVCSCIIAYVYSQRWYCADRSYAFLSMGGVRSRKYCASISDMTTTCGLRREVVLRINLPRASIEARRMLWHLSSNGSRGWLRNWGKGYVCREVSSARITSRGNKIWQFKQWYILSCNNIIGGIATWGVYYFARITSTNCIAEWRVPLPDPKFIWGKNRLSTLVCNDHGRFPVPSVLLHRGLVILSQFVTDYLCWY